MLSSDFAPSRSARKREVRRKSSRDYKGTAARHAHGVRFGSKADMYAAIRHVRFTPNTDHKSGHWLCRTRME